MRLTRRQDHPLGGVAITAASVVLGNGTCGIRVVGGREVPRVSVSITGDVADPAREAPFFDAVRVMVTQVAGALSVREENTLPPGPERDSTRIEVEVALPAPAATDVSLESGAVELAAPLATQVRCGSGSVRIAGPLRVGEHDVTVHTGTANLVLSGSSSLTYELRVRSGSITAPNAVRAGVGLGAVQGRLGGGHARLGVRVGTGVINLRLQAEGVDQRES